MTRFDLWYPKATAAFRQGYQAWGTHMSTAGDNPFHEGTPEATDYDAGMSRAELDYEDLNAKGRL